MRTILMAATVLSVTAGAAFAQTSQPLATPPAQPAPARPDPAAAKPPAEKPPAEKPPAEKPVDNGPNTPQANNAYQGGGVVLQGAPGAPSPAPQPTPTGQTPQNAVIPK